MATTAAPKDKLDTPAIAGVNGPEGGSFADWDSIDWDRAQENVRRLRQHIFTASREVNLAKVRNLQKLMLRSLSNTLVSVRRVTEVNAGRKTAGVDGQIVLTAPGKAELARFIQQRGSIWQARPVRRVFIPKNGSGRSSARSVFPWSSTGAIRLGRRTHWSPSGRPGSRRGHTASAPAGAATTRSGSSTTR